MKRRKTGCFRHHFSTIQRCRYYIKRVRQVIFLPPQQSCQSHISLTEQLGDDGGLYLRQKLFLPQEKKKKKCTAGGVANSEMAGNNWLLPDTLS